MEIALPPIRSAPPGRPAVADTGKRQGVARHIDRIGMKTGLPPLSFSLVDGRVELTG